MPENGLVTVLWTLCLQRTRDHGRKTVSNTHDRHWHMHKKKTATCCLNQRAENEARTRDPNLGKVVLYQLSYFRINFEKCLILVNCEGDETRTHTTQRSLPPQSSASTSFAITAYYRHSL